MRGSTFKNFTMFTKLCGTANLKNVLFVTTKWDLCQRATAESRQKEMTTKYVKNELEAGARLTHHDNTIQSACGIIRSLMDNPPVVLTIQRELVDMKKTLAETDAGEQLDAALTEEREKWAKEYADSLEAYKKETDAHIKKILEDVNTKNKEELDSIDRQ
jgi:formate dehydrogenase maturation protein FdhE